MSATPHPLLTEERRERYGRHLGMPEVGDDGQARLLSSRVLVVGAGGLGSASLLYLAAAGVGTLGVADPDRVEVSNLQRQVLHHTGRVGQLKVESAADTLRALNPDVTVIPHPMRVERHNARALAAEYDLVVDACDSFATRYVVGDAAYLEDRPFVHGSVFRLDGQASTFLPVRGLPCYRCLFPVAPPAHLIPPSEEAGPLSPLPGIIGTIQATEALKLLLGVGESLAGRLLCLDGLSLEVRIFRVQPNPACPLCGESPTITDLGADDYPGP